MSLIMLQHHDRAFVRDETLAQGQPTRHHTTSRARNYFSAEANNPVGYQVNMQASL